jgi:hypothetical protein
VTETDVYNLSLGKLGGAGDSETGTAFITSIDGDDKVSQWGKLNFPRIRRRVIKDLATKGSPFRATVRFLDLGTALDTTPEIGQWDYAFTLPGDCLMVVSQFDEDQIAIRKQARPYQVRSQVEYQWEMVADTAGNGKILLTDTLSNTARDSAFIEFIIDTPNTGSFSEEMIDCIATLMASEVAPIIGRDMEASNVILAKYEQVVLPNAQAANQRGFNNTARSQRDWSGGRSKTLSNRDDTNYYAV